MRTVTIIVNDEFGNVTNYPQNTYQLDLETKGFDLTFRSLSSEFFDFVCQKTT